MRRFLGLVPPPAFAAEVLAWQAALGHRITAPHVTVKAPPGLSDDLAWRPRAEAVCAAFPPFPVTLAGVRTFGKGVIYLAVDAPAARDLHVALVDALGGPDPAAFEGRDAFVPHLTLVLARAPLAVPFGEALERARAAFARPVVFDATLVRLYRKPVPGGEYEPERDLPLGG